MRRKLFLEGSVFGSKALFAIATCLILTVCTLFQAQAQRDLIVTQAGEEIRCRILDETPTRFLYAYIGKGDKILRNEIFKNLVRTFKYNNYDTDLLRSKDFISTPSGNSNSQRIDTRKSNDKKGSRNSNASEQEMDAPQIQIKGEKEIEKSAANDPMKKSEIENKNTRVTIKEEPKSTKPAVAMEPTSTPKVSENAIKPTDRANTEESANPGNSNKASNSSSKTKEVEIKAAPGDTKIKQVDSKVDVKTKQADAQATQQKADELKADQAKLAKMVESSKVPEKSVATQASDKKLVETPKELSKEEKIFPDQQVPDPYKNYLKYRVGIKAGIGNINTNSLNPVSEYDLYKEKLLKGWTFGADAAFFIKESFGIGAVFTNFQSKNSNDNISYTNLITNEVVDNGSISNKVSHKFIGPSFYYRKGIDFKTFVVLGVSPGMYLYSDKGTYNKSAFHFKGQSYGAAATLGVDFLLGNDLTGRDIILSLEAGYNYGRLTSLDYGNGLGPVTLTSPIVMDRLDFSVGLRFMRFPRYLKQSN